MTCYVEIPLLLLRLALSSQLPSARSPRGPACSSRRCTWLYSSSLAGSLFHYHLTRVCYCLSKTDIFSALTFFGRTLILIPLKISSLLSLPSWKWNWKYEENSKDPVICIPWSGKNIPAMFSWRQGPELDFLETFILILVLHSLPCEQVIFPALVLYTWTQLILETLLDLVLWHIY